MIDKTPEQILALAKHFGVFEVISSPYRVPHTREQAVLNFAAALTAARPDKQLQWTEKTEDGERSYSFPLEGAIQLLADLYKEWPGGLEEIASALRTKAAQPLQPATPLGYINRKDIERLSNYKSTIWPGENEIDAVPVYLEPAAQPVPPAKQQSQPTNMAPCEVLRNHGKCWRNACVVAGACTAPLVQPAEQQSQDALDAVRYKYMIDCDYQAGRKYCPGLDEVAYKAKLRAKHDTAIAARGAK